MSALKVLMQSKIACANSIHDLDTLDGITDDWSPDDAYLMNAALELHLHCEAATKECHAMVDILDAFMTDTAAPSASAGAFVGTAMARCVELVRSVPDIPCPFVRWSSFLLMLT